MKRRSLVAVNQTIALLIFTAACVIPIYSQELRTTQTLPTAQRAFETIGEDVEPADSAGAVKSSPSVNSDQGSAKQAASKPFVFPTKRERFNRYVKSTVGPFAFARTAISAGIDQWRDNPEEWEQGASGYGKRYASGFGKNAIQQTVVYCLDSTLGLDTGFRRSTRKGFFARMTDALAENTTSRTKTGKRVISVPRLAGVYTSRIIAAETWYPERYSYKDGLRSGTRSLLTGFGLNLIREFVIRF